MLKPIESFTREIKSLDGLWSFAVDSSEVSPDLSSTPWTSALPGDLECPVPASYNDIFPNHPLRSHVGKVFYQKHVRIPRGWSDQQVFLRLDSATHEGEVYVNDQLVVKHVGGYTPFQADLTAAGVKAGEEVRITISVSNILTRHSIPPGELAKNDFGETVQKIRHDFFNYAGLARSGASDGEVKFDIKTIGDYGKVAVDLLDVKQKVVASSEGQSKGTLSVANAILWQPGESYLYNLRIRLLPTSVDSDITPIDEYVLPVGIRSVRVEGIHFLINDKPFYFKGYGRHEDLPVKGKGHDNAWMVHDFELMKWSNANSFRTSHYPYAEEVYEYADRQGFVIIDETAAVGLNLHLGGGIFGKDPRDTFSHDFADDTTREAHAQAIREWIARDRNHPSVVMWCITNEPGSQEKSSRQYFEPLVKLTKELDPSRPVTFTNMGMAKPGNDYIADLFDVIGINRYYGWYEDTGDLRLAEKHLLEELLEWQEKYKRPLVMCEYGADTVTGLHSTPALPWSEEYQASFYEMYHRVFDKVEAVQGEQVWNFADFSTGPGIIRVDGNRKGVFSRDRRPKMAAHVLKKRWEGKQ